MRTDKHPPDWMSEDQKLLWEKAFGRKIVKKQTPANALTSAIRDYCHALGCATARINTTGIYDEDIGKWRKSNATLGVEDIDVTLPISISNIKVGLKIAVEVKIGRDRQSDHQKKREHALNNAGAHYIIAHDFDQFKIEFDSIINTYANIT